MKSNEQNDEPLMNEEQAGEAVARYLEENPELLDGIAPSDDLWPAIENRISARVLPLQSAPRSAYAGRTARRTYGWVPMLLAASALVATSAGITYELTSRGSQRPAAVSVASSIPAANHGTRSNDSSDVTSRTAAPSVAMVTSDSNAASRSAASVASQRTSRAASRLASTTLPTGGDDMRSTYDAEIATLHDALEARRGQLNPGTVAVIEQNLRVINDAIRQSRAALAKDPNSSLLNDQLDRTLAKKTGLLRAAALLPAA